MKKGINSGILRSIQHSKSISCINCRKIETFNTKLTIAHNSLNHVHLKNRSTLSALRHINSPLWNLFETVWCSWLSFVASLHHSWTTPNSYRIYIVLDFGSSLTLMKHTTRTTMCCAPTTRPPAKQEIVFVLKMSNIIVLVLRLRLSFN